MPEETLYDRSHRARHADHILRAAISAADPGPLVQTALRGAVDLDTTAGVRLLALGKAAPAMAAAAGEVLQDSVRGRLIVAPHGTAAPPDAMFGGHPAPDESSLAAGRAVRDLLQSTPAGEALVVLLSGGASATAVLPLGDITIAAYADCVTRLMRAGADIRELNIVRKHIDGLKGGRMAVHAAPAAVLGLVLSDVVGDPLDIIASGPLTPDVTTCADALHVLQRRAVLDDCAPVIRRALERCDDESPGEDHPAFANVRVRIIGGNDVAIDGAAAAAAALGYRVVRATEPVTGPAREAGTSLAREARLLQRAGELPVCIVAGGETTVAVQGSGRGGRNQEIVLAACLELNALRGITVGSIGTDGIDGNSDAAGAVADEASLDAAAAQAIDPLAVLAANDACRFFEATGGLLITGPTGTNVNDVQIALVAPPDVPMATRP